MPASRGRHGFQQGSGAGESVGAISCFAGSTRTGRPRIVASSPRPLTAVCTGARSMAGYLLSDEQIAHERPQLPAASGMSVSGILDEPAVGDSRSRLRWQHSLRAVGDFRGVPDFPRRLPSDSRTRWRIHGSHPLWRLRQVSGEERGDARNKFPWRRPAKPRCRRQTRPLWLRCRIDLGDN